MDCQSFEAGMMEYHFGTASDEARAGAEAHLLGCAACLRGYLALKREIETGPEAPERPSAATRARLRASVAAAFPAAAPSRIDLIARLRAWIARPIPLYQGVLAAALLVTLVLLAPSLLRLGAGAAPEGPAIDTARETPASMTIF